MSNLRSASSAALFCALATIAVACGKGGGMDTGGGDIGDVRSARIRQQLSTLQQDLLEVVTGLAPEAISEEPGQQKYRRLLDAGLIQDIRDSRYTITQGKCYRIENGKKTPVSASAGINDHGGAICFSLPELIKSNASDREILSLAIHEHSHHLGYDEAQALDVGESLAGFFAAQLFYYPPNHSGLVHIPRPAVTVTPKGTCLNFPALLERVAALPPDSPSWITTHDIRVESTTPPTDALSAMGSWFLAPVAPYFYDQPAVKNSGEAVGEIRFYQDGCDRLIIRPVDGKGYSEVKITSFTPTEIRYEGSLFDLELVDGVRQIRGALSAPAGSHGLVIRSSITNQVRAVKSCKQQNGSDTQEVIEGVVTHETDMHFGEPLPAEISMASQLASLLEYSSWQSNTLAVSGCNATFASDGSPHGFFEGAPNP